MAGEGTERLQRAVPLLVADPELGVGIPADDLELARRTVVVPEVRLEADVWQPLPAEHYGGDRAFALLVLEGMLTREVALADRSAAQVLGPGDVCSPWAASEGLVPAMVEWTATAPTRLAVLDDRVVLAAQRWPSINRVIHERLAAHAARLAVHIAIAQLPRVDQRVLAIMWHLAERFGRVTSSGVVLPLRMTHEALGRLVGAQRPTVTLALRELVDTGALERYGEMGWLLREGSQVDLAPELESLAVGAFAVAAALGEDAPDEHADARPGIAMTELARLDSRVLHLREQLPDQARYVTELLERCRTTTGHSSALRERLSSRRSPID